MARKPRAVHEHALTTYGTRLDRNGRIVLPAPVRKRLGVEAGDEVVLRVEPAGVRLTTVEAAVREAQALVRRHVRPGVSLVDDLLAWRRSEVGRA